MSPRERGILVLTIVVVLGVIGFRMLEPMLTGDGAEATGAKADFLKAYDSLRLGPEVRVKYAQLNTKLPPLAPGRTPELTFTDEVTRMLNARGWPAPQVEPAKTTAIKEANDYYYIDLLVKVNGPLRDVMNLLADFQDQNIIIKQFKMEKANMDAEPVALEVTVSRMAKYEPDDVKKRRGRNRR